MLRRVPAVASVLVLAGGLMTPAFAQQSPAGQGPGWFVPPGGGGAGAGQQSRPAGPAQRPPQRPAQTPLLPPPVATPQGQQQPEQEPPPINVQLPPIPDIPALPRGSNPPAAVIGVLGIPEIMRASAAAQQIEKALADRKEKLNEDAQKEQAAWRDMQQSLANQRATLTADQIRNKEKELQDRITNAQKTFRYRNRIIQEAGQYGLAQIERVLISTIRQVAESKGMNLVMHRAQIALNVNDFDITDPVVEQLNKILPSVVLPPDGVSPAAFTPPGAVAANPAPAAPAAPAVAPASAPAVAPAGTSPAAPRR